MKNQKQLAAGVLSLAICGALLPALPAQAAEHQVEGILAPAYDGVMGSFGHGGFSEGLMPVEKDGKYGFLNTAGQEAAAPQYNGVSMFSEGLAAVQVGEKWGFIDKTGQLVIPARYDTVGDFQCGRAMVGIITQSAMKYGYIDTNGVEVVPVKYDTTRGFREDLAVVQSGELWGYVDRNGVEVIPPQYDFADNFFDGRATVNDQVWDSTTADFQSRWGFIDKSGEAVIPLTYDMVNYFSEGCAAVQVNGSWGYIDTAGAMIVEPRYGLPDFFMDGMAVAAVLDGDSYRAGYVDRTGREVVPPQYEYVRQFHCGLGAVLKDGKWGYVDKLGRESIPPQYDNADEFMDGLAVVQLGDGSTDLYGLIDTAGKQVLPVKYAGLMNLGKGYLAMQNEKDGRWGLIHITTTVTAQPSPQSVKVNGQPTVFEVYNIEGSNYFKLRDMAMALNGTQGQFGVGYDAASNMISLTRGAAYVPVGGEMSGTATQLQTGQASAQGVKLNGESVSLTAYNIGGSNFFRLRDLGDKLGFGVDYDAASNTVLIDSNH